MNDTRAGFILPLAAVGVALLALALFTLAGTLGDRSAGLRRDAARWKLEVASATVEARVAHLALTEPLTASAIDVGADGGEERVVLRYDEPTRGKLVLDGRPYETADPGGTVVTVAVQDEAGLFNLNVDDEAALARLLTALGVAPRDTPVLAAALADFTDSDDLRRVNGAESGDYTGAGLPSPRNAPLAEPADALTAFGWPEALTPGRQAALLAISGAGEAARPFNPNTAPAVVLAALLGLDERGVAALLAARAVRTMTGSEDVAVTSGADMAGMRVAFASLPARDLRVTILPLESAPEVSFVYASSLHIADEGSDRPLFWKRSVILGSGSVVERNGDGRLDRLPDSPALFAARER